MANVVEEKKFLGQSAVERLIENTKDALDGKQPKGDYALKTDVPDFSNVSKIYFDAVQPAELTTGDLWIEISDLNT